MTFEEWFREEFAPSFAYSNDDPYQYESVARRAWEASREMFAKQHGIEQNND
jgi:hypothetical protein